MAAYIVFFREKVHNPEAMKEYGAKARRITGHPVTPLALYGKQEVVEGPALEGVAILAFPSFEEAQAWYHSPEYADARQHRFDGAEYRAVIVEGL